MDPKISHSQSKVCPDWARGPVPRIIATACTESFLSLNYASVEDLCLRRFICRRGWQLCDQQQEGGHEFHTKLPYEPHAGIPLR